MDQNRYLKVAQEIVLGDQVQRTSLKGLAFKNFVDDDGTKITAIEQNPDTSSEWAAKARAGRSVIQFRNEKTGKYVAVSVDGELTIY